MTRKRNLEIALAFETKLPLKTTAQETTAQETTAHERQIEMANTHWRSTSSTSYFPMILSPIQRVDEKLLFVNVLMKHCMFVMLSLVSIVSAYVCRWLLMWSFCLIAVDVLDHDVVVLVVVDAFLVVLWLVLVDCACC